MQATKTLLERALKKQPAPVWRELLELSEDAISVAKHHGRLSPVMAGGMALELGEDPEHWIAIAAIENARESKARDLLIRRLKTREKPSFYAASKGPNTGRRGCRRGSLGRSICNTTLSTTQNFTSRRLAISVFVRPFAHQRATCAR